MPMFWNHGVPVILLNAGPTRSLEMAAKIASGEGLR